MEETKSQIHPPKLINSNFKCLTENQLEKKWLSDKVLITTETWVIDPPQPWSESGVITGKLGYKWITKWEAGLNYVVTKYINDKGDLVGIYCDITSVVKRVGDLFEYKDHYLDVFQPADGQPILLDEDEFIMAIKSNFLSKEEAKVAKQTVRYVIDNLGEEKINI